MKYKCDKCSQWNKNAKPCYIESEEGEEPPEHCPFDGTQSLWEVVKQ